jgi:hypothetical protein
MMTRRIGMNGVLGTVILEAAYHDEGGPDGLQLLIWPNKLVDHMIGVSVGLGACP